MCSKVSRRRFTSPLSFDVGGRLSDSLEYFWLRDDTSSDAVMIVATPFVLISCVGWNFLFYALGRLDKLWWIYT